MIKSKSIILSILFSLFFIPSSYGQRVNIDNFKPLADSLQQYFQSKAYVGGKIRVDSIFAYSKDIVIYLNNSLAEYPFRDSDLNYIYKVVNQTIPNKYINHKVRVVTNGSAIEELVPPIYSSNWAPTSLKSKNSRRNNKIESTNIVKNNSKPYTIDKGLNNRHLAIWQSHGYYYEQKLLRWEWQRARIFQTVEDLYTQSYVLPFLVPMLENAGATVFLPRERDFQKKEVICDNDSFNGGYAEFQGDKKWKKSDKEGFANPKEFYLSGENPFKMGSARVVESIKRGEESRATWSPNIKEAGNYAVYISYHSFPNSTENAQYRVIHSGGESTFTVNQNMGGGTWIYLGTFHFSADNNRKYRVELSNLTGRKNEIVSADGVKFGGGMGNIAREPSQEGSELNRKSSSTQPTQKITIPFKTTPIISNYPRFTEGARYWLQWAGFNDTIYTPNSNANDYNDDYMSRGKWVNALIGGSSKNPTKNGYNIPIDLAFAFHSDAGTTLNDSIIGTLGIYTRYSNNSDIFPSGSLRFHNRYLTDIIQTEIVNDIKSLYEPIWQRRGIWDKSYSEARTPEVPTMLLELLSHQNFADMRYGLDPQFKFDVSRAIYKGMLKFLSQQSGLPYIVQPLPVKSFSSSLENNRVALEWKENIDSLEPTARANNYVVYTRINGEGFDNGVITETPNYEVEIEPGIIYSFKVTAINQGGESFPSEILSLYKAPNEKGRVLIINGFDRVSAPASFASADTSYAGFFDYVDNGVPYLYDISYIGSQYEFRREIPWMDDDSPGFGSSYANYETKVIAGNTFDYPYIHGKAFAKEGYSFFSKSRDALEIDSTHNYNFDILDLILGKQIQTKIGRGASGIKFNTFPKVLRDYITGYSKNGGNILISGANVATDLWDSYTKDTLVQKFAKEILKYEWRTNQASITGEVKAAQSPFNFSGSYNFHTKPNQQVYSAESPDALEPYGKNAWTIMRYADNNISAAVAHKSNYNTVVLGFPIETIKQENKIDQLIKLIISFFTNK
ncbi:MAG: xanthan lyase [Bacteroidales bacterium]